MFVLRSKGKFFYARYIKELATYNSKTKLKYMLFDVVHELFCFMIVGSRQYLA